MPADRLRRRPNWFVDPKLRDGDRLLEFCFSGGYAYALGDFLEKGCCEAGGVVRMLGLVVQSCELNRDDVSVLWTVDEEGVDASGVL